ncbi:MAG TPA: hypothetical protein VLB80_02780, partial [Candidatus Babeliales bacterium]|nr:hypothetical protein [Candidatus Babeliales bacterium]
AEGQITYINQQGWNNETKIFILQLLWWNTFQDKLDNKKDERQFFRDCKEEKSIDDISIIKEKYEKEREGFEEQRKTFSNALRDMESCSPSIIDNGNQCRFLKIIYKLEDLPQNINLELKNIINKTFNENTFNIAKDNYFETVKLIKKKQKDKEIISLKELQSYKQVYKIYLNIIPETNKELRAEVQKNFNKNKLVCKKIIEENLRKTVKIIQDKECHVDDIDEVLSKLNKYKMGLEAYIFLKNELTTEKGKETEKQYEETLELISKKIDSLNEIKNISANKDDATAVELIENASEELSNSGAESEVEELSQNAFTASNLISTLLDSINSISEDEIIADFFIEIHNALCELSEGDDINKECTNQLQSLYNHQKIKDVVSKSTNNEKLKTACDYINLKLNENQKALQQNATNKLTIQESIKSDIENLRRNIFDNSFYYATYSIRNLAKNYTKTSQADLIKIQELIKNQSFFTFAITILASDMHLKKFEQSWYTFTEKDPWSDYNDRTDMYLNCIINFITTIKTDSQYEGDLLENFISCVNFLAKHNDSIDNKMKNNLLSLKPTILALKDTDEIKVLLQDENDNILFQQSLTKLLEMMNQSLPVQQKTFKEESKKLISFLSDPEYKISLKTIGNINTLANAYGSLIESAIPDENDKNNITQLKKLLKYEELLALVPKNDAAIKKFKDSWDKLFVNQFLKDCTTIIHELNEKLRDINNTQLIKENIEKLQNILNDLPVNCLKNDDMTALDIIHKDSLYQQIIQGDSTLTDADNKIKNTLMSYDELKQVQEPQIQSTIIKVGNDATLPQLLVLNIKNELDELVNNIQGGSNNRYGTISRIIDLAISYNNYENDFNDDHRKIIKEWVNYEDLADYIKQDSDMVQEQKEVSLQSLRSSWEILFNEKPWEQKQQEEQMKEQPDLPLDQSLQKTIGRVIYSDPLDYLSISIEDLKLLCEEAQLIKRREFKESLSSASGIDNKDNTTKLPIENKRSEKDYDSHSEEQLSGNNSSSEKKEEPSGGLLATLFSPIAWIWNTIIVSPISWTLHLLSSLILKA